MQGRPHRGAHPSAGVESPVAGRLGVAVVRGDSMRPGLRPGDRLLVRYAAPVRPGAVVVARLADGTVAVKRAAERRTTRRGAGGWWLLSDDPAVGVDSRHRGPVADDDVLGVVLARLWPRPGRVRGGPPSGVRGGPGVVSG